MKLTIEPQKILKIWKKKEKNREDNIWNIDSYGKSFKLKKTPIFVIIKKIHIFLKTVFKDMRPKIIGIT